MINLLYNEGQTKEEFIMASREWLDEIKALQNEVTELDNEVDEFMKQSLIDPHDVNFYEKLDNFRQRNNVLKMKSELLSNNPY